MFHLQKNPKNKNPSRLQKNESHLYGGQAPLSLFSIEFLNLVLIIREVWGVAMIKNESLRIRGTAIIFKQERQNALSLLYYIGPNNIFVLSSKPKK